ncbi:hypothetical protein QE441_002978 [Chryseobacterium sp. SORGH_AS909]|uniref:Uncharacterized protein n=1 Tax=Chryseobacterium camelliae TaxID=1265445 RepID=A0ABU0TG16_9FLAO|nr:hypothetical protein [Chryseobacterium camelliae]MDR6087184.1 hypothetical protein [Chryseobacterium sp. SORGH_AS_0909]
MFTAFFVLAQVSKKIKIGHDFYILLRDPFVKFKNGHEKSRENRPIGSLMTVHFFRSQF